ncbi:hypothetical protein WJX74_010693 [Apatococcus lobatus]|uniref:CUE domain-containing protein n=1 Tax=Apatococcus lobatus TaxID=904363 RepID=A0AAW1S711_9CHLO
MSVAARSPFPVHGSKRRFESDSPEFTSSPSACGGGKRLRQLSGSPSLGSESSQAYAVRPGLVATLQNLYPGMDEKTVVGVLDECGNDIDAAIRRLGQMKLSSRASEQGSDSAQDQAVRTAVAATAPEALLQQSPAVESASAAKPSSQPGQPQTMEEWVDALIQHMSAAKDMDAARQRGREFLTAFEGAITEHARPPNALPAEPAAVKAQVQELLRDNGILKRAVQIQAARMQDSSAKDSELGRLRQQLTAFQERIHSLEMSNYSLSMHLRQAMDAGGSSQGTRPPDVF